MEYFFLILLTVEAVVAVEAVEAVLAVEVVEAVEAVEAVVAVVAVTVQALLKRIQSLFNTFANLNSILFCLTIDLLLQNCGAATVISQNNPGGHVDVIDVFGVGAPKQRA